MPTEAPAALKSLGQQEHWLIEQDKLVIYPAEVLGQ